MERIRNYRKKRRIRKLFPKNFQFYLDYDNLDKKLYSLLDIIGYDKTKELVDIGRKVAEKRHWSAASEFLGVSPKVIKKIGYDGFLKVLNPYFQVLNNYSLEADTFLKESPGIIDRVGYDGLQKVADYSCLVGNEVPEKELNWRNWRQFPLGSYEHLHYEFKNSSNLLFEENKILIDELLKRGDKSLVMGVYDLWIKIAQNICKWRSVLFLDKVPSVIDKVGLDGLEKIVNQSFQIDEVNKDISDDFFKKSFDLFERFGYDGLEKIARISRPIAKSLVGKHLYSQSECFNLFLEDSPDIIDRVGYEGLEKIARSYSQLTKNYTSVFVVATFFDRSYDIIDRVGYEGLEKVINLACRKENSAVASKLLKHSTDIIDRVGYEGLEKVADLSRKLTKLHASRISDLYRMIPFIIDENGFDYLENIFKRAGELAKKHPHKAEDFLRPFIRRILG